MDMTEYLTGKNWTKTDLAKRLGVSKALVGRWEEIPEKYQKVLDSELPEDIAYRDWWIHKDHLHWGMMGKAGRLNVHTFGHGSEFDYNYSMAKIEFIRKLLKQLGSVQAVVEWVHPVEFENQFVKDVKEDIVCPNVVDMRKPPIEGGRPVPKRVFPFGDV